MKTLWVPGTVIRAMQMEALDKAPLETGGVLMGYERSDGEVGVLTDWVGPGPNAIHRLASYVPDHSFQDREIGRIYERSGRMYTYLGDWHTHPTGGTVLSTTDRKTMKRISRHAPARCPAPLMLLLAGKQFCAIRCWQWRRHHFWRSRPQEVEVKRFDIE